MPLPLMLARDLGIEEEGVITSVPCHVDEADQATVTRQASGHPAKAVGPDLVPPPGRGLAAMCPDKRHHFRIGDRSPPAIFNRLGRHMRDRPAREAQASTCEHGRARSCPPRARWHGLPRTVTVTRGQTDKPASLDRGT